MVVVEAAEDGRPSLARLEESDDDLLAGFFERLSPKTVYRRFFSPVVRLGQLKASLLSTERYDRDSVAALAGGKLVGLAQYSRRVGSEEADVAVVVADGWQRQGIGTRLVAALADQAWTRGITGFAVSVQGDNPAAIRLYRRFAPGAGLKFAGGVGEAVISLGSNR